MEFEPRLEGLRRLREDAFSSAHTGEGGASLGQAFYPCCDALALKLMLRRGFAMTISVSEEVQTQLDQVKEWMESKIGREVTYNDVIIQILRNFQSVMFPEDLGSA
jgi:hypothetical protein